jgi:hypothetical protein
MSVAAAAANQNVTRKTQKRPGQPLNLHKRGLFPTQLFTNIVAVESWEGTPMSGGLTRACAMASAFFALIFFFAVTLGAFAPSARSTGDRPHVAQGQ